MLCVVKHKKKRASHATRRQKGDVCHPKTGNGYATRRQKRECATRRQQKGSVPPEDKLAMATPAEDKKGDVLLGTSLCIETKVFLLFAAAD